MQGRLQMLKHLAAQTKVHNGSKSATDNKNSML